MRYSHQREVIEKIVRSTKTHPNAEWVYKEAKKKIENISLGTVYRNLKILERTGSIKSIHDSSQVRYDGNVDDHHHLKCIKCGVLIDTDIKSDYDREKIIENYDFEPDDIKFFIIGKCKKHKKNKQGVINGFSR
jgi:Fur family peroxide stress response transcriptional regulator